MKELDVSKFDDCIGFGVAWDEVQRECKLCSIVYGEYYKKCKEVNKMGMVWRCRKGGFGGFVEGDELCEECKKVSEEVYNLCIKLANKKGGKVVMEEKRIEEQKVQEVKVQEQKEEKGDTLSSVIDEMMFRGATPEEIIAELDKRFPDRKSMRKKSQIVARGRDREKKGYKFIYENGKCVLIKE